jgi:hypothetical protein
VPVGRVGNCVLEALAMQCPNIEHVEIEGFCGGHPECASDPMRTFSLRSVARLINACLKLVKFSLVTWSDDCDVCYTKSVGFYLRNYSHGITDINDLSSMFEDCNVSFNTIILWGVINVSRNALMCLGRFNPTLQKCSLIDCSFQLQLQEQCERDLVTLCPAAKFIMTGRMRSHSNNWKRLGEAKSELLDEFGFVAYKDSVFHCHE